MLVSNTVYFLILNQTIESGIFQAKQSYYRIDDFHKLEGSIAGFEACRNCSLQQISDLIKESNDYVQEARLKNLDNYWFFRCYNAEVYFVYKKLELLLNKR